MATIKFTKTVGGLKYTIDGGTPFEVYNEEFTTTADDAAGILTLRFQGIDRPFVVANHTFVLGSSTVSGLPSAIKDALDSFVFVGPAFTANQLTALANWAKDNGII